MTGRQIHILLHRRLVTLRVERPHLSVEQRRWLALSWVERLHLDEVNWLDLRTGEAARIRELRSLIRRSRQELDALIVGRKERRGAVKRVPPPHARVVGVHAA